MKWFDELIFDKITRDDLKKEPLRALYGVAPPSHIKIPQKKLKRLNELWLESSLKVTDKLGNILGFALLEEYETHIELEVIFVLKEYQRRGIGTQFFKYCAHIAAMNGKPMKFRLDPTTPWLIDFYKKADPNIGFEER